MRLHDRPLKAYLFNDLSAVEEHDRELIYFFKKRACNSSWRVRS